MYKDLHLALAIQIIEYACQAFSIPKSWNSYKIQIWYVEQICCLQMPHMEVHEWYVYTLSVPGR